MAIMIQTVKIVPGTGIPSRKITKVECLSENELPKAYMRAIPHCYLNTNGTINIHTDAQHSWRTDYIAPEDVIEEDKFQELLTKLTFCGSALSDVRKSIEELRKTWNGKDTFYI